MSTRSYFLHFSLGKSERDGGYERLYASAMNQRDYDVYDYVNVPTKSKVNWF